MKYNLQDVLMLNWLNDLVYRSSFCYIYIISKFEQTYQSSFFLILIIIMLFYLILIS